MKIYKLLMIPQVAQLDACIDIAAEYHLGFEYNDFFSPVLLEDEDAFKERILMYKEKGRDLSICTLHGAFLDITVCSDDPMIARASDCRVEQSIRAALALGVNGIVFHTNYIANFKSKSYRDRFVEGNAEYWKKKLERYPALNIYIENMFDDDPELLARLGERLQEYPNFGVCFDYAHAHVFGSEDQIDIWVKSLAPYVKHLHINDNDFYEDQHLAVGDGRIDWKRFREYYERYFPEASVLIEVNGIEKIRRSLNFIHAL